MYVCVYVCMYVCVCVCMYAQAHTRAHTLSPSPSLSLCKVFTISKGSYLQCTFLQFHTSISLFLTYLHIILSIHCCHYTTMNVFFFSHKLLPLGSGICKGNMRPNRGWVCNRYSNNGIHFSTLLNVLCWKAYHHGSHVLTRGQSFFVIVLMYTIPNER